jgi:hypothetical protein
MKRLLSTVILLSILTGLTACQNAESPQPKNSETTKTEVTTEINSESSTQENRLSVSDDLETVDYNGREFNILLRGKLAYEFDAELTGDVLDDAIYNRNRTVEERFNIKIVTHPIGNANNSNILEVADKSILAGDDAYQLLAGYTYHCAPGSVNGNYVNWYDVPNVNFDKPWWSKGFIDEASVNGKVFVATGDLSLLFNEVTLGVLFNKNLAASLNIDNLYSTVINGDWTLDLMREYCALATQDLNGDGIMDENDRWGLGINTYTHIDCFLYAFNVPVTSRNANGVPELAINSQKMIDVLDKVYSFLIDSGDVYVCQDPTQSFMPGMFESDKGLFMTTWLGNCANLRDMNTDFGIIPYPKFDETQEDYSTYYLDRASSFLVPVTADLDYTGIIVEALAAESYKRVIPAFYELALKSKYARDNESQEMIDIILSNVRFDFGNIYTYAIGGSLGPGHLLRDCIIKKNKDFASLYASKEATYNTNLKQLIEKFN